MSSFEWSARKEYKRISASVEDKWVGGTWSMVYRSNVFLQFGRKYSQSNEGRVEEGVDIKLWK